MNNLDFIKWVSLGIWALAFFIAVGAIIMRMFQ